jgi:chromosome segregation ATPase
MIERQLRQTGSKLRRLREELQVIEAQLPHMAEEADDLEIRSLVSDGSGAAREFREAKAHSTALAAQRNRVAAAIIDLEQRQDNLLDRLAK